MEQKSIFENRETWYKRDKKEKKIERNMKREYKTRQNKKR
jgi:hypothetical protein